MKNLPYELQDINEIDTMYILHSKTPNFESWTMSIITDGFQGG